MAFEITIPRLGWSMEEGTFVRWLKHEGDYVKAGEAVFELEGEKAAQDIEAVDSGILRIPPTAPKPGTVVPVGAVIGYLVAEGESIPASTSSSPAKPAAVATTSQVPRGFTEKRRRNRCNFSGRARRPAVCPAIGSRDGRQAGVGRRIWTCRPDYGIGCSNSRHEVGSGKVWARKVETGKWSQFRSNCQSAGATGRRRTWH